MAAQPSGPTRRLPLVIGVTGHRDLRDRDLPRLRELVADVLRRLRADYLGGDRETPVIVLSSLAEGADQLVARAALDQGIQLIAPLPMAAEEFRRDFEPGLKPGAAQAFDDLFARALATPIAPHHIDATRREDFYRAVGVYIVRHCDVLIALWDGDSSNMAAGGTAEVVRYKREGIPLGLHVPAVTSLDPSLKGPVIHIHTPRQNHANHTSLEVGVAPWGRELTEKSRKGATAAALEAERSAWEIFKAVLSLTRRFNREAAWLEVEPAGTKEMELNLARLFEEPATNSCNDAARTDALARAPQLCEFYKLTDSLAQRRQRRFRWDWMVLSVCGLLAFLCFEYFSHLRHDGVALLAYSILMLVVFGVFFYARGRQNQEQYLDYRALAEALRVGLFWRLLGVTRVSDLQGAASAHPRSLATSFMPNQHSELAWITICLRSLELLESIGPGSPSDPTSERNWLDWARTIWIDGQRRFFERQGKSHHEKARRLERVSLLLLSFSLLIAAAWLGTALYRRHLGVIGEDVESYPWLIFTIGVLPGFAAALAGYSERLAYMAQARQYDRMRTFYKQAYDLLTPKTRDIDGGRLHLAVYADVGNEAMRENAEWVAIFRQRPIRPPHGG
jgi:hypothetical protein